MTNTISVVKRDNTKESLNYDKINKILIWATEGISGVSASDIAMNAGLQFYNKITTEEIHNVLIQSAVNMISVDNPNYQYVASKLTNYLLRKKVFNTYNTFPKLQDFVKLNVDRKLYDPVLIEKYDEKDFSKIENFIKHSRDEELTYAGIQQLMDKYLVKDRSNDTHYETPQFAYILISMTIFADLEDKKLRLKNVKECYDLISTHVISLPTPIVAGVRTPNRQFSSCTLIDVDDTLDSIIASDASVMKYIAKRAGIGLNLRIRGAGSRIRNGEVVHTGIIPFIKKFEATVKSCSQGGIRNGSATVHYPFWHTEIEDIVVLKNNRGNDLNRARRLDHSIQLSRIFYRRFIKDENITLFSTTDVPGLYDAFGDNDKFDELYVKYENDKKVPKKVIKARDLMSLIAKERLETGRIYIQNIDNVNDHNSFYDKIRMSNLCQEIVLPTVPLSHVDDGDDTDAEIALCTLAGYNLGAIKNMETLKLASKYIVLILDKIIEMQDYPVPAAKKMLKRRSIGVGVTNYAYWLIKNDLQYGSKDALKATDELFEHIQYYLLDASSDVAEDKGECEWFNKTKYSDGIFTKDHYNKNVDKLVKRKHSLDWNKLKSKIKATGLRNSVYTAIMPVESSSLISSSINGIELPKALITQKKSKSGSPIPVVVPEISKYKNKYQFAFSVDNGKINDTVSVIQKWIDQAISVNHYYDKNNYGDGNIPMSDIVKDILQFYKYGGKQLYYANSKDGMSDKLEDMVGKDSENDVLIDDSESDCGDGGCTL